MVNMPARQKDLYQVLGLKHGVRKSLIERAYETKLERLRRIHTAEASARVAELERSAAILLNSDTKEAYDDGWAAGNSGRSVESQTDHDIITIDDDNDNDNDNDNDDDDVVELISPSPSLSMMCGPKYLPSLPVNPSKGPKFSHRIDAELTPKFHLEALQEIKEITIDDWKEMQCQMTIARHAWKYDSDPMVRLCAGELYEDLAAEEARAKITKQKATNTLVEEKERAKILAKQYKHRVAKAKSAALVLKRADVWEMRMKQRGIDAMFQRGGKRPRG